jgi:putative ABC transport system ATP-binding protein
MPQETFIRVDGLRKSYEMGPVTVHALDGVDLAVPAHSFSLIVGPSGSGKSTLLYLIGGLDRPSAGSIRVNGLELETLDENALAQFRRRTLGFIFQSFNLIPSASALENVSFPLRFSGIARRQRRERALQLLERVGLADRAHHKPSELSGGQQQRVAIARALVNNPALILADEPTGNLDTASGEGIMNLLASLHAEGASVVVVSHDPRLMPYASQIINILDGKITSNEERNGHEH